MKTIIYNPAALIGVPNLFGDGSDGDVTISSNTTLTQIAYYNNLTIDSGFTLTTAGFPIYVKNRLTNNGTISANGGAGGTPTGGAAGAALVLPGGTTGGIGHAAVSNGNDGGAITTIAVGVGGAGGDAGAQTGGASYGAGDEALAENRIKQFMALMTGVGFEDGTSVKIESGSGAGGGGNASGAGTVSGGGGGGAGYIAISAKQIANNGTISANGGAGGDATGAGNAGGGGGGGGGALILLYLYIIAGTLSVAGGTGGAKVGTGIVGSDGGAGLVLRVPAVPAA